MSSGVVGTFVGKAIDCGWRQILVLSLNAIEYEKEHKYNGNTVMCARTFLPLFLNRILRDLAS